MSDTAHLYRSTRIGQGIHRARRLHTQALASERQADVHNRIAIAIGDMLVSATDFDRETLEAERNRQIALYDEFIEDHDDLLGQIDPDLIDYL